MFTLGWCDQDAVQQGCFNTDRSAISARPDLRTVAMTALEIASAMTLLHSKGIVHGVGSAALPRPHFSCIHVFTLCGHDCLHGFLGHDLPPRPRHCTWARFGLLYSPIEAG